MSYNCKNYTEQGGDVTHIGGKLIVEEGGSVEGLPASPKAENQADSTASDVAGLKADFNSLLAKLKAAGFMEPDAVPDPDPTPESDPTEEGE
jgi:hypothetical protein